jgi:hypothetical protein
MEILITFILDSLLSPIISGIDDIDTPVKGFVIGFVLIIAGIYGAMAFHKSVQPLVLLPLLCLGLVSCEGTVMRKSAAGDITFADGSAGEKSTLETMTVTLPDGTKIEKFKLGKDQADLLRRYLFWAGMPKMLDAVGGVAGDVANGVDKVIK